MNTFKHILIILFSYTLFSCDVLEKENLGAINDIWNDEALVEAYVNNLYYDIPGWEYTHNVLDNSADEGRSCYSGYASNNTMLAGLVSPTNNPIEYWKYEAIRKCNELILNLENSTIDSKAKIMAEAKFFRAYHYFIMTYRYGGVPLITVPQAQNDDLFTPRSTSDECFEFVIKEFTEAAELFEQAGVITTTDGHASQGAALALKTKAQVYYASPLFNPTNDASRWTAAAETAKLVMAMDYELYDDFANIYLHETNKEIIFKKSYSKPDRTHGRHDSFTPLSASVGDVGYGNPVQELVDAFPMKNGKAITDAGSGYDLQNPYVDRDDRFYATIAYNGCMAYGRIQYTYYGAPIDGMGEDRGTVTGYFGIKAIDHELEDYHYGSGDYICFIHSRLADIYLMYAEAQNEANSSPDESVYTILEKIRQRAGCDPYQIQRGMSKDQMREFIQNERYIEFAFEQNRYWDLNRWKLAVTRFNGKKMHGVSIVKLGEDSYDYSNIVEVDPNPIVFKEHMYLLPIKHSEIIANPSLEGHQNPGY